MIAQTIMAVAEALEKACGRKVVPGDLSRESEPPDKIVLMLLDQARFRQLNVPRRPQPTTEQPPQTVELTVVAGCYFSDYLEALSALDATVEFVWRNPRLRNAPGDDPIDLAVDDTTASEQVTYWSSLRMPPLPCLFLKIGALWQLGTANTVALPIP